MCLQWRKNDYTVFSFLLSLCFYMQLKLWMPLTESCFFHSSENLCKSSMNLLLILHKPCSCILCIQHLSCHKPTLLLPTLSKIPLDLLVTLLDWYSHLMIWSKSFIDLPFFSILFLYAHSNIFCLVPSPAMLNCQPLICQKLPFCQSLCYPQVLLAGILYLFPSSIKILDWASATTQSLLSW